jgi:hypothetical protein
MAERERTHMTGSLAMAGRRGNRIQLIGIIATTIAERRGLTSENWPWPEDRQTVIHISRSKHMELQS